MTQLGNAITSLKSILNRYNRDRSDIDIRDGVIQRFKVLYFFATDVIKKYIFDNSPEPDEFITYREMICQADKFGILLNDINVWSKYNDLYQKRNNENYEQIANSIISILPQFIEDTSFLLNTLEQNQLTYKN